MLIATSRIRRCRSTDMNASRTLLSWFPSAQPGEGGTGARTKPIKRALHCGCGFVPRDCSLGPRPVDQSESGPNAIASVAVHACNCGIAFIPSGNSVGTKHWRCSRVATQKTPYVVSRTRRRRAPVSSWVRGLWKDFWARP